MPLEVGTVSTKAGFTEEEIQECRNALRSRDSFNLEERIKEEVSLLGRNALRSRDSFNEFVRNNLIDEGIPGRNALRSRDSFNFSFNI